MARKGLWAEMIDTREWLTEAVFVQALYQIVWRHKGDFLPEPATALEFFAAARVEVERETAKVAAAALPPPAPRHPGISSLGELFAEAHDRSLDDLQRAAERQRRGRTEALAQRGADDPRARVVRVEWVKDGEPAGVSEVELPASPRIHDSEARRKEREALAKQTKPWDLYECLCGTAVIRYPDGRLVEAADQAPHSCLAARRGEQR